MQAVLRLFLVWTWFCVCVWACVSFIFLLRGSTCLWICSDKTLTKFIAKIDATSSSDRTKVDTSRSAAAKMRMEITVLIHDILQSEKVPTLKDRPSAVHWQFDRPHTPHPAQTPRGHSVVAPRCTNIHAHPLERAQAHTNTRARTRTRGQSQTNVCKTLK